MNGMPWYRRYNDSWKNPLWGWIGGLAQARAVEVQGVFFALLDESSGSEQRGAVPKIPLGVIAHQLEIALETVERIVDQFVRVGLIAGDIIVGWAKRQGEAAARAGAAIAAAAMKPRSRQAMKQEAYRKRKADADRQIALELGIEPAPDPVTRPVTPAEKAVTNPVTSATDRDRDSESSTASAVEGERVALSPAPETRAGPRKTSSGRKHGITSATRRSRFPADWQPGDADHAFAARYGRDSAWVDRQAELFAAHHGSKGTLSTDWHKSWRTWVLRDQEFECRRAGAAPAASLDDWRRRSPVENLYEGAYRAAKAFGQRIGATIEADEPLLDGVGSACGPAGADRRLA